MHIHGAAENTTGVPCPQGAPLTSSPWHAEAQSYSGHQDPGHIRQAYQAHHRPAGIPGVPGTRRVPGTPREQGPRCAPGPPQAGPCQQGASGPLACGAPTEGLQSRRGFGAMGPGLPKSQSLEHHQEGAEEEWGGGEWEGWEPYGVPWAHHGQSRGLESHVGGGGGGGGGEEEGGAGLSGPGMPLVHRGSSQGQKSKLGEAPGRWCHRRCDGLRSLPSVHERLTVGMPLAGLGGSGSTGSSGSERRGVSQRCTGTAQCQPGTAGRGGEREGCAVGHSPGRVHRHL